MPTMRTAPDYRESGLHRPVTLTLELCDVELRTHADTWTAPYIEYAALAILPDWPGFNVTTLERTSGSWYVRSILSCQVMWTL